MNTIDKDVPHDDNCVTNYNAAKEGYSYLSNEAKELFSSEEEYIEAYTRYQNWCYSNNDYISRSSGLSSSYIINNIDNSVTPITYIIIIIFVSILSIFIYRKNYKE